jgi:hypothetical protein
VVEREKASRCRPGRPPGSVPLIVYILVQTIIVSLGRNVTQNSRPTTRLPRLLVQTRFFDGMWSAVKLSIARQSWASIVSHGYRRSVPVIHSNGRHGMQDIGLFPLSPTSLKYF